MTDIRDTYRTWADVPPVLQKAVLAYDYARRSGTNEPEMSERNMCSIAPMIARALDAAAGPDWRPL